jgi:hypothetical protein
MGGEIYQRFSTREEIDPRRLPPLAEDHPLVDEEECPGCGYAFEPGDVTTLIIIGPGNDREAREKHKAGRFYPARAIAAHYACVTGEEASS